MTWREELEAIAGAVPADELPELIGELARQDALARRRLVASTNGQPGPAPALPEPERLLTAEEAAEMLGVTPSWLYRHELPFARKLSPRVTRYSLTGLRRWAEMRRS